MELAITSTSSFSCAYLSHLMHPPFIHLHPDSQGGSWQFVFHGLALGPQTQWQWEKARQSRSLEHDPSFELILKRDSDRNSAHHIHIQSTPQPKQMGVAIEWNI